MDSGGDASKGGIDPDDTLPLDVAEGELRSSTDRTRYHPTYNDMDDVELHDDENPAQYSNTPVLGTATLEMSCRGELLMRRELADLNWTSWIRPAKREYHPWIKF